MEQQCDFYSAASKQQTMPSDEERWQKLVILSRKTQEMHEGEAPGFAENNEMMGENLTATYWG